MSMICEVDAIKPNSRAVPCDVFYVVQLFCSVFRLCVAEDVPAHVIVVICSPCGTEW